jgi:hypothetical protein
MNKLFRLPFLLSAGQVAFSDERAFPLIASFSSSRSQVGQTSGSSSCSTSIQCLVRDLIVFSAHHPGKITDG